MRRIARQQRRAGDRRGSPRPGWAARSSGPRRQRIRESRDSPDGKEMALSARSPRAATRMGGEGNRGRGGKRYGLALISGRGVSKVAGLGRGVAAVAGEGGGGGAGAVAVTGCTRKGGAVEP
ncbi:hypothetical protein NL676_039472 [Syzygium grande]|nr:hypothetical protein NL676_039472 [Syzygium grande]